MSPSDADVFVLHAEVCKALANPKRLEVIHRLAEDGRLCASDLMAATGLSKTNLSQHMRILRTAGVVEAERDGAQICYRLASRKIARACNLLREFLAENLERRGHLAVRSLGKDPV